MCVCVCATRLKDMFTLYQVEKKKKKKKPTYQAVLTHFTSTLASSPPACVLPAISGKLAGWWLCCRVCFSAATAAEFECVSSSTTAEKVRFFSSLQCTLNL